jgi:SAM-dependent methyltransferase
MRWNAPLSEQHAALLLDRLAIEAGATVVDLGCGWGELLLRAIERAPATGIGVDTDEAALERGRALATDRGLTDRVRFVNQPAAQWREPADRVLCVGASHAWGGTKAALEGLTNLAQAGSRLLYGDGCWERTPTAAAQALFDEVLPLAEIVEHARVLGWRVLHLSTADQREWDDFESTWRAGRQEWLLANPAHEAAHSTRKRLDEQLAEYLDVYRGVLGHCYLVLAR